MSRIFDALQRSESERPGTDTDPLPQGPDLLKRAEHRAASKWESRDVHLGTEALDIAERRETVDPKTDFLTPTKPVDSNSNGPSIDQRFAALEEMEPLPVSLAPQSRLVCITDRESPTAEAIRLLGVRLRDFRRVKPLKKVLVTSTIPQEGKSTVAANLACALAYGFDERTLLLEGDLRRPSLAQMFGIKDAPGMFEWLSGDSQSSPNIYRLPDGGPWFLPAGKSSRNPIEFLQSDKLRDEMDRLAAWFDWIIIDSPPVLPLADASVWMRIADGVLLVTREGITEKHQLQKGVDALDPNKTLGAIVNGSLASEYSGYYSRASISS